MVQVTLLGKPGSILLQHRGPLVILTFLTMAAMVVLCYMLLIDCRIILLQQVLVAVYTLPAQLL